MGDLLQQLENNEAILLMYLAGELPEQDRREVEQMLASDAGLRATLAELAALQDDVTGLLARADAAEILARRETVVRRVGRTIAAANSGRPAAPVAAAPQRRFHVAWWAYPIAAAAAFVVAVMILSDGPRPVLVADHTDHSQDFTELDPTSQSALPQSATAQIFPEELERELISLRTDDVDLFSAGTPDAER
jgi:anti-sigma-K factor RskA